MSSRCYHLPPHLTHRFSITLALLSCTYRDLLCHNDNVGPEEAGRIAIFAGFVVFVGTHLKHVPPPLAGQICLDAERLKGATADHDQHPCQAGKCL